MLLLSVATVTSLICQIQCSRILQITDIHLDVDYNRTGDPKKMCHYNPGSRSEILGEFGDYLCDSPKSLVKHIVKAAAQIIPKPELLLLTGDFVPHIENYDLNYVSKNVQIITSYIQSYFPNITVLPVFGNHDSAPSNYFPDHDGVIYKTIYPLWRKWIGEVNMETFLKGGYYKYDWKKNAVIVSLNTNLYYRYNGAAKDFKDEDDPAEQFNFFIRILEDAKESGKTVHVVAHIAPGAFERSPYFTWMEPRYNQRFINITIKYANTIGGMIFGHHHSDTFHIVTDPEKKQPVQVYLMAPSVTPWFSSLPGAGSQNPSFRIYNVDDNTQKITDATTYWVDLTKLNHNGSLLWTEEYSMKTAYNIDSISALSMNSILERMKNNDEVIWSKYIEYNSVKWDVIMPQGIYRAAQLCAIEHPDLSAYNACMKASPWTTEVPTISTTKLTTTRKPNTANIALPMYRTVGFLLLLIGHPDLLWYL